MVGNYYYGESNLEFLTSSPRALTIYRSAVVGMMFLGAMTSLDLVWSLADVTMGVMAVINLLAIAPLGVLAMRLLADYQEQRRRGLDPVFTQDRMPDVAGIQCWQPRAVEREREGERVHQV